MADSNEVPDPNKIYIDEMASLLDRSDKTIRSWVRDAPASHALADARADKLEKNDKKEEKAIAKIRAGALPVHLYPQKESGRGKIFWTRDQLEDMKSFSEIKVERKGWDRAAA
jgi:hypothetical protein